MGGRKFGTIFIFGGQNPKSEIVHNLCAWLETNLDLGVPNYYNLRHMHIHFPDIWRIP